MTTNSIPAMPIRPGLRSIKLNTEQVLAFHTQELLEAHRQLTIAGVITHLNGQPLTISQRCAIAREALVAWGCAKSVLTKAMQKQ
jgi:hypothetical protein